MSSNISLPILDYHNVSKTIENFISKNVKPSFDGVVLGLSGGLDSSVLVNLCVKALGKDNVFGVIMPENNVTPTEDTLDGENLAKSLGIEHVTIGLDSVVNSYGSILPHDLRANGNLLARIRMNILYHYGFIKKSLVLGTSDKSELYIGYFTKYGDGGSDLIPIADLYKVQVRELAKHLSVPNNIINKKSSPRLWPDHEAEKEIGIKYEQLDVILHAIIDLKLPLAEISQKMNEDIELIKNVEQKILLSEHKRNIAPICYLNKSSM